jgi:putative ABC transport system substrate-binding protein
MGSKQLELLLSVVPKLSRVGILVNPVNPTLATLVENVRAAAQGRGVVVQALEARTAPEIERAFAAMTQAQAGAVIVPSDSLFVQHCGAIARMAVGARLASVSLIREFAELGGLMSYGPSFADQFRRAATFVDMIFKGAKPADLPVEQSTTFELVVNRKTATTLGLTVPDSVLMRADRVIG